MAGTMDGKIMAIKKMVEKMNANNENSNNSRSLLITPKDSFVIIQLLEKTFIMVGYIVSK